MTWRERVTLAASLGAQAVDQPVYHWTERRKGTTKRYGFVRVGKKKYSLGSNPTEQSILMTIVHTERDRRRPYSQPLGQEVNPSRDTRRMYAEIQKLQNMVLGPTGRRHDGKKIRFLRGVDPEEAWRQEFRAFSRPLLEARTWPGITEEQWVGLRREIQAETKRGARLGKSPYFVELPREAPEVATGDKRGGRVDGHPCAPN